MPKASSLQSSFNSGEVSPLYYGQSSSPRHKAGLEVCYNYIPTLQGPLLRRPGTHYVNIAKDGTVAPTLIPFKFSSTQNYMLEFGEKYIRFYTNGAQMVSSGSTNYNILGVDSATSLFTFWAIRQSNVPLTNEFIVSATSFGSGQILELVSPYLAADAPQVRYAQSNDTLYLVHPSYPTFKLQRYGNNSWTLRQVRFNDGPTLPYNSYSSTGDSTDIQFAVNVTGVTNFWTVTTNTTPAAITGAANNGSGLIRITSVAHGLKTGQKVYISGVGGTTEANNNGTPANWSWTVAVASANTFDLIGSAFVHAYTSGGTINYALFSSAYAVQSGAPTTIFVDTGRNISVILSGKRYYGYITLVSNAAVSTIYIDPLNPIPALGTTTAWSMGVYSYGTGFPAAVAFHQDRLGLAGCPSFPQQVDLSMSGSYEFFSISDPKTLVVADNDAIQVTLNSSDSNPVQWMSSTAQGLCSGTSASEWVITPSSSAEALTPTNINASESTYYGSAGVNAVKLGNATLFVQRASRKVREMTFFFQAGTFRAIDVSEIGEHLTIPSITQLAVQKEAQPLVWAVRSDGVLLSMVYNRDDTSVVAGWARHGLGGTVDSSGAPPIVTSIAVIPSPDGSYDQLWMVVKRISSSTSSYNIEYLTKTNDDSTAQEDATLLDSSTTYDVPLTITAITTGATTTVTANSHGFTTGDTVRISSVTGLQITTTDINGNVTRTSAVNGQTFLVGTTTTSTFILLNFDSTNFSTATASDYVSGGEARLLVSSISGLTYLAGQTVSVLADGGIHPDTEVTVGGVLNLSFPAAKVQIGYSYKSRGKLLRIDAGSPQGSSIGATRRSHKTAMQLHRVGDLKVGTSFDNMYPVQFTTADVQQADQATPLYSGIQRLDLESEYDFNSQVHFEQSSPLPGTIQSITTFMEEFDV